MKLLLFFCFILLFGLFGSGLKKPVAAIAEKPVVEKPVVIVKDTIDFTSQIQPILIKSCSPCHFTGGKMYDKLPFDKDTTIINHQSTVLKRIKGEENSLIKTFIEQKTKQ